MSIYCEFGYCLIQVLNHFLSKKFVVVILNLLNSRVVINHSQDFGISFAHLVVTNDQKGVERDHLILTVVGNLLRVCHSLNILTQDLIVKVRLTHTVLEHK